MAEFDLVAAQRAVFVSSLPSTRKLVLLAIVDHWSRKNDEPYPGVARLAHWTSLDRRTVMRSLQDLESTAWLTVGRSNGRANRYELVALCNRSHGDTGDSLTPDPGHGDTGTRDTESPEGTKRRNQVRNPVRGARSKSRSWTRVPETWEPTPEHRELATKRGVNFEDELAKFRDHEFEKKKTDPDATFRNWLRRAFGPNGRGQPQPKQPNSGWRAPGADGD